MRVAKIAVISLSALLFACSNGSDMNTDMASMPIQLQDLQKEWQLVSIDNNMIDTNSSLSVDEQAKATGNLACNNFFGTVTLQENKIRIDKMGSTRKICEPSIDKVEMTVSNALSTWSEVKISAEKLTLTGEKHTLVYTIK